MPGLISQFRIHDTTLWDVLEKIKNNIDHELMKNAKYYFDICNFNKYYILILHINITYITFLHCYDVIKNITTSRHSKSIIMHTHGFTDQPWVRMTGYQVLFLCVYELRWRQSINYTKKKDNIKPRWLNKLGQKRIFYMEKHTISFLWHSPSKRHLGCSDNQSQCRIWFILPAHRTFILC